MARNELSIQRLDEIGRDALLELLNRELALVPPEIEAKLSEVPHPELEKGINPHVLTRAKQQLIDLGEIEQVSGIARGGRAIDVLMLTDQRKRKTAIEKAAARKRLLHARYLSWAAPIGDGLNLIGEAGERVTRASLRQITEVGYVHTKHNGDIGRLFGQKVPVGPVDAIAYLTVLDNELPIATTVIIEVKNVRHWIYPSTQELYQLLDKCAQLQIQHPAQKLVPVLVCRRLHYTTFRMAKDLGFIVLYLGCQPILPRAEVPEDHLKEVVDEMGYDLIKTDEPLDLLVNEFKVRVPKIAARTAIRWANNAPALAPYFTKLRSQSLSHKARGIDFSQLRKAAATLPDMEGGW